MRILLVEDDALLGRALATGLSQGGYAADWVQTAETAIEALATGKLALPERRLLQVARLGALAADCLARAIARGVYEATPWPGTAVQCWRDLE